MHVSYLVFLRGLFGGSIGGSGCRWGSICLFWGSWGLMCALWGQGTCWGLIVVPSRGGGGPLVRPGPGYGEYGAQQSDLSTVTRQYMAFVNFNSFVVVVS